MSLNWRELELILSELPLEGSYIQKVTEHSIHSFTLSMYSREEKAWLLYFEIATPDARVVRTGTMRPKTKNAIFALGSELLTCLIIMTSSLSAVCFGYYEII